MSLTRTRLRVAVRVMRYYNLVPLTGAITGIAPFRGRSNHQFTSGYDFPFFRYHFSKAESALKRRRPPDGDGKSPGKDTFSRAFLMLKCNLPEVLQPAAPVSRKHPKPWNTEQPRG